MLSRFIALAVSAALLSPLASHADPATPETCTTRQHPTFAKFLQPSGGSVEVQTTPTGSLVIVTGGPTPGVSVSTTGTITVEVEAACLLRFTVTARKAGAAAPVYTRTWEGGCDHITVTDQVKIGLDAGQYDFAIDAETCSGGKLRQTADGNYVADPPVL